MEVLAVSSSQLSDKSKAIVIMLIIALPLALVTIHNRIAVLVGSFIMLVLALYVYNLAASSEYESFRIQLTLQSSFITAGASILLVNVFSRVFTDFVAESGTLSLDNLHKLIVVIILIIPLTGILPPYLWLYRKAKPSK